MLLKLDRVEGFVIWSKLDKFMINNTSTVPLNYNFTFTLVSTCGTTRGSRGKCQKIPWKASFPCDGPWLFHAKTRGISRHVEFP